MSPRNRLICSALTGGAFAFLTWIVIGDHVGSGVGDFPGTGIIFLLPGLFAGFAASGNVHTANIWLVASGNFVFYSGLAYLLIRFWTRRRTK